MRQNDPLTDLLQRTLEQTQIAGLPPPSRGKVRDVYDLGERLLIVTTDRISAFDVVLGTIPCKGQVLNTIAAHWFEKTAEIVTNHVVAVPDPCAMVVRKLKPLPVEVVVRRFITGSLWRDYERGERDLYGLKLPERLRADERFPEPIITPTTKATAGQHDAPTSAKELIEQGQIDLVQWRAVEQAAFALFARGEAEALKHGLLLVDTKYEFGLAAGQLVLMDEIHTPDSSRYWEAAEYEERLAAGRPQLMLDKENIRQWLLQQGFSGNGTPPPLTDEIRLELARTYLKLQQRLTGIEPEIPRTDVTTRLLDNLRAAGIIR